MVSLVLLDERLMVLESLAGALRRRGHIVLATATDPDVGIASTLALRPDICVVNRSEGSGDGLDVVRSLRGQRATTRILVLWDRPHQREVAAARAAGADGLLATSSSIEKVSLAVTKLDRGAPVWPDVAPVPRAAAAKGALTAREWQVLELVAAGAPTVDIAAALGITINTARTHVQRVLCKLGVKNRFQAAHVLHGGDDARRRLTSSA